MRLQALEDDGRQVSGTNRSDVEEGEGEVEVFVAVAVPYDPDVRDHEAPEVSLS